MIYHFRMFLTAVISEHNDTVPFDLSYFKGCLLDTDVELDTVEVLLPKKISLHQDEKVMVNIEISVVKK